jgi:hypothetical protein
MKENTHKKLIVSLKEQIHNDILELESKLKLFVLTQEEEKFFNRCKIEFKNSQTLTL